MSRANRPDPTIPQRAKPVRLTPAQRYTAGVIYREWRYLDRVAVLRGQA